MVDTNEMRKLAQKANERKTIYPALEFTPDDNKFAEGFVVCRFRDNGFTTVENPKATGNMPKTFFIIHVDVLENTDFGQTPGIYQLKTAATNSALTDGILKVWQANNENLEGVKVSIEAYNYVHKTHGKTRGYRVAQIKEPKASPAAKTPQ